MLKRTLIVRLDELAENLRWYTSDAEGQPRHGRGRLDELPALLRGRRLLLLVPGDAVLLTHTELQVRNRQQLRRALPFALEEQLADDVDALHFAIAPGSQPLGVAVVARTTLEGWLARLAEHDLQPDALLPETLALPIIDGEWTLLLEDLRVSLRCGPLAGLACEPENLPALLELLLAEATQAPVRIRGFDARSDRSLPPGAILAEGPDLLWQPLGEPGKWMAEGLEVLPINLLQGEYSRQEQLQKLWRPWRVSAALLLAFGLLQLGLGVADYQRLKAEDVAQVARMEQIYKQAFPEAKRIVNPRHQLDSGLQALKGGGGDAALVSLLARCAPPLQQQAGLDLTNLRYREGRLELELRLPDLSALDKLKAALGAAGLSVNIQNASSREGKVESRMEISEVGA